MLAECVNLQLLRLTLSNQSDSERTNGSLHRIRSAHCLAETWCQNRSESRTCTPKRLSNWAISNPNCTHESTLAMHFAKRTQKNRTEIRIKMNVTKTAGKNVSLTRFCLNSANLTQHGPCIRAKRKGPREGDREKETWGSAKPRIFTSIQKSRSFSLLRPLLPTQAVL